MRSRRAGYARGPGDGAFRAKQWTRRTAFAAASGGDSNRATHDWVSHAATTTARRRGGRLAPEAADLFLPARATSPAAVPDAVDPHDLAGERHHERARAGERDRGRTVERPGDRRELAVAVDPGQASRVRRCRC